MKYLDRFFKELAASSKGNPVLSVATIMLFFVFFNLFEASIEQLIWGERFNHILDPFFCDCFYGWRGLCGLRMR
jgi:hypothetical protein